MIDNIDAITEIYLLKPFIESLNTVVGMVNLFGMKLLRCKAGSNKVHVSIPSKIFKKILGENPRIKTYSPPKNSNTFISKIVVTEIRTNDEKNRRSKDK